MSELVSDSVKRMDVYPVGTVFDVMLMLAALTGIDVARLERRRICSLHVFLDPPGA